MGWRCSQKVLLPVPLSTTLLPFSVLLQFLSCIYRGFIKGQAPGKLTGCEQDLANNLPGYFHLLFLLSFIRKTKDAWFKNPTDLLLKNWMKPLYLGVQMLCWSKHVFRLIVDVLTSHRRPWMQLNSILGSCFWKYSNALIFCVGFLPHIVSASNIYLFIYLFICPLIEVLVTWFLVWVFRREKTGFQYTMFRGRPLLLITFLSCWFLLILKIFRALLLVYKVRRSRFPFWRFPWVYLSLNFLYSLKFWLQNITIDRRKPITFTSFLSALFLIWDFSSVISLGVYNRRSFCHRSCLALFTSKQSSPWTFRYGEMKLYMFNV